MQVKNENLASNTLSVYQVSILHDHRSAATLNFGWGSGSWRLFRRQVLWLCNLNDKVMFSIADMFLSVLFYFWNIYSLCNLWYNGFQNENCYLTSVSRLFSEKNQIGYTSCWFCYGCFWKARNIKTIFGVLWNGVPNSILYIF